MRAGQLRHRVEVLKRETTQDDYGSAIDTWPTQSTRHVSIEPLQGREAEHAHQMVADATVKVRMRYDADVTEANRLQYGTRILEIANVSNVMERNAEMILLCREVKT